MYRHHFRLWLYRIVIAKNQLIAHIFNVGVIENDFKSINTKKHSTRTRDLKRTNSNFSYDD